MKAKAFAFLAVMAVMALSACQPAQKPATAPEVAAKQPAWAAYDLPELSGGADFSSDRERVATCLTAGVRLKQAPETCIGVISAPCLETDSDHSTASKVECLDRETAIWGALLSSTEATLNAKSTKVSDAMTIAHKSFFANRDAQCALPYVTNEGATIAHVLSAQCANDLTARQVLRLQAQITPHGVAAAP